MVGLVKRTEVDGHRLFHKRRPGLIHAQRDLFLRMAINDCPPSQFRSIQRDKEQDGQGGRWEVRTSMFMTLQIKFREEARSADDDERGSGRVSPEVRSKPVKGGPGEVVGNNEGIRVDKLRVLLQNVRNVLIHAKRYLAIWPFSHLAIPPDNREKNVH